MASFKQELAIPERRIQMDDMKWYFIFCAVAFGMMFGGMAIKDYSENQTKKAAIVACYNSGHQNCEKIWSDK
jgi:hypothetical protein